MPNPRPTPKIDFKEAREAQTRALATFGFGPAFPGGDWMSPEFASCLTCGAVVVLRFEQGEEQPAVKHDRWHAEMGATSR